MKSTFLTLPRLIGLYFIVFCAVGLQQYLRGHYNNYLMFTQPFHNLLLGKSLYGLYPDLYIDSYKYSPTFAWLMGPFYRLPDGLGVVLWNALNTAFLIAGVWVYLSDNTDRDRKRLVALLIIFLEALTTAQNLQSNNLIGGAILLGLYYLRKERVWLAAFFFTVCLFFKFYGVGAAIFFLFYPKKGQFLLAMISWTALFALAPWTIISLDNLLAEYREWLTIVVDSKLGKLISVPGILVSWFGMAKTDGNLRVIEAVGIILFLLPFTRVNRWSDKEYQQRMVAYFLVFVIIFNKMAESPTYVLAVVGVALWWVTLEKIRWYDGTLLALVIVFTALAPSDLFPKAVRELFVAYSVKAVPCVLVWLRIQWQLWVEEQVSGTGRVRLSMYEKREYP